MRADRLVTILLTLQVYGSLPTCELARRLEVSPRTIHRDMDVLSGVGIPVFALRGRNGGWSLPDEYRGTVRWLSSDEVRALAVRSPDSMLTALGVADVADAAWLKLVASLPPVHRHEATRVSDRIFLDVETWKPRHEAVPMLPLLKEAVFAERQMGIRYRDSSGATSTRVIAPLGLVARGTTWYVVADVDDDRRTYRVSRIEAAELTPDSFTRPEGFDLATWWKHSKEELAAKLPTYPVCLRVAPDALEPLRRELRWGRIDTVEPPGPDGWHEVSIMFELLDYALATVLSLGGRAVVLEPEALREATQQSLCAALALYEPPAWNQGRDTATPVGDTVTSLP